MDTKEQILKKAKKLFAKHGFDGVSIRSICDKASCNVSAISYHFGSKEELYRACLEQDGSYISGLIDRILTPPENAADFKVKLRLFVEQNFEYFVNNRDLVLMISKDATSQMAMNTIHKIFHTIPEKLEAFFQQAIDKKILNPKVNPAILVDLINQPLYMQTLFSDMKRTHKQNSVLDAGYRQNFVEQMLMVIFESILT